MDIKEILARVDHTLLKPESTWDQIREICDDGIKYQVASVCIPPGFVKKARDYVGDRVVICTVIGFPNGYNTLETKVFETKDAIKNGAGEIDMVINIGDVKSASYAKILDEIKSVKEACGDRVLKVIIETCLLTEDEKIKMAEIVTESKADFIKTSTGFASGGATREDVSLLKKHVGKGVRVKASGGISSIEDAVDFIKLGADRLGTSRIVKIVKEETNDSDTNAPY